ncbi:hypothetical protein AB6809_29530 [Paraburkholderia sp. RCC_158]|uniref:hypothetical protein n=1 Tax=Paraburkholderia sp. RCC_158 TaxID=3239220 RepID=UPI003525E955
MRLTCNQLILLLALYRGSPVASVACGTKEADFKRLRELGYVDELDCMTRAGDERVVKALTGVACV